MSQELLPCPVCCSVAELNETEDHAFVVLCSDIFCTGNFGSSQPTKAEAIAAWNVQARLWENRSCPNCNWSEEDEQGFLEHQQNLPKFPYWKKMLRRFFFIDLPFLVFVYATNYFLFKGFSGFSSLSVFISSCSMTALYVLFLILRYLLKSYFEGRILNQYFDNN